MTAPPLIAPPGDNPSLLCQDCSRQLFNWFLSRIDWRRILKEMQCATSNTRPR